MKQLYERIVDINLKDIKKEDYVAGALTDGASDYAVFRPVESEKKLKMEYGNTRFTKNGEKYNVFTYCNHIGTILKCGSVYVYAARDVGLAGEGYLINSTELSEIIDFLKQLNG